MPIARFRLPDGRVARFQVAEGTSPEDAQRQILQMLGSGVEAQSQPPATPPTERTYGEAAKDVGAGLVQGVGNLVQLPGQLYGLATGDFSDTGVLGAGKRISEYGSQMESKGLKAREAARDRAVQDAEQTGQWAAFKTSFLETVKDPALLSSFIAEQLPQLLPIILTGGAAASATAGRVAAAQMAKGATADVAATAARSAAVKAGTTAAIQTGATMQGTDVGAGAYDAIYQNVLERGGTKEAAAEAALNRARAAGVAGYGLSVLANRYLIGGDALEKALVGGATGRGMLAAGAAGALKEIPSEVVEETGGALASNVALKDVDPTQSLTQGLGQTAAQATIGAAALGGGVGAWSGRGPRSSLDINQSFKAPPTTDTRTGEPVEDDGTDDLPDTDADLAKADSIEAMAATLEAKGDAITAKKLRESVATMRAKAEKDAVKQARAAAVTQASELLGQVGAMPYAELVQAKEALKAAPKTDVTDRARKAVDARIAELDTDQVLLRRSGDVRASESGLQGTLPDLFGLTYPDAQTRQAPATPGQPEVRPQQTYDPNQPDLFEAAAARESAFAGAEPDLFGQIVPERVTEPEAAPTAPERPDMRAAALQMPLNFKAPLRKRKPKAPFTATEVAAVGGPEVLVGRTPEELQSEVTANPQLANNPAIAALLGGETQGAADAPREARGDVRSEPAATRPGAEPGMELPDVVRPGPTDADAQGAGAPDGARVGALRDDAGSESDAPRRPVAALTQLENARTRADIEQAMDGLVAVQQDPAHPDQELVADFITRSIKAPGFDVALRAAEDRARKRRRAAEDGVRGAVQQTRPRLEAGDAAMEAGPGPAQGSLIPTPPDYERQQAVADQRRATVEREAHLKDAWAGAHRTVEAKKAQGTLFRTQDPQPTPARPIGDSELRRLIKSITKSLGLPETGINVLDSVRDFDPSQEAGRRAGAMRDGQVYLFRDGIESGLDGQKTIFHELLHRGLRNLLPPAEYTTQMLRLYVQNEPLRRAANKWLQDPQSQADIAAWEKQTGSKMPQRMQRALAVEESLATMAETRKMPGVVRSVGNWLANLAARMGMGGLARHIRTMGMTELEAFIDDALRAVAGSPRESAPARFRTNTPNTQTAQQTDRMLGALDMRPSPEASRLEQAGNALNDAVQNPRATSEALAQKTSSFVDKLGTAFFSSNFALNRAIRKQLQGQLAADPQAMGLALSISDSQVDGSSILAGLFARHGNLEYRPDLYKWEATDSTSMQGLAETISGMAETHGISKEQASKVVDAYFEARRTQKLIEQNAELGQLVDALNAAGMRKEARERAKRRVEHLKDQAWVDQAMQFETMFPELATAAEQWNEVRANATKIMVDSGLWTPEMAEDMLSAAEYVPFYREEQLEAGKGPREYITGLRVKAKEYRLKGSERAVNDIFDNMLRWTQYAVERSVRNHMAIQRIDAAVQYGLGEQVNTDAKVANGVKIWRAGAQEQYKMADPLFVDAFAGLEAIALPALGYWSKITNVFRQAIVLNPLFGALQVPQDAIAAIYTSGLRPQHAFTIPARAVKEFLHTMISPETNQVHKELRAFGATGARDTTADVIRMDLEMTEGAKSVGGLPAQAWRNIKKGLHHIAMASDSSVRQAVYSAALQQGLSRAEALEKAFQVINFRNRGTSKGLALFARTVPFLNAYMAAQHVAYKTLSGNGISPTDRRAALETLATTALGMMGLSALYAMANGGDEGYEKRPLYVRDRVFVIPGTGGISIPMRPDVFAFPKVFAEHMWHHITDSGTVDGANTRRSMSDLLGSSLIGPYAPQALKPAVEVAINYDFFRQRPLVGSNLANVSPEYRFTDSTSEFGKLLGQTGVISPVSVDHLMRGYLGSLGGLILYTSNAAASTMNGTPRPDMALWDAIASFPGASSVLPKQSDTALRQDFYELKEAVDRVTQTITLLNGRNPEALDAYLDGEDVMERYALSKEVNAYYRAMLDIRKAITLIRNDTTMSAPEKRAQIEELQREELELLQSMDLKALRREARL